MATRSPAFARVLAGTAALGLILIIAPHLLVLVSRYEPLEVTIRVFEHLGIALVVAAILGGTVDYFLKDRFTREVVENLSSVVIAFQLPPRLREEVENLCSLRFFRKDVEWSVEITHDPSYPELMRVKHSLRFKIVNLSDDRLPFDLRVGVQAASDNPPPRLISVGATGVVNTYGDKADFEHENVTFQGVPRNYYWETLTHLPPRSFEESASTFWWELIEYFERNDRTVYFCRDAGIGVKVRVAYPEGFAVDVGLGHRLQKNVRATPAARPTVWELDAAFLPMFAVAIWWRPVEITPTEDESHAPELVAAAVSPPLPPSS